MIAAKALANLDLDDPNYVQYPPNVYPLHPRLRTRQKPKADIVFIHGLLGGVFFTWRQKDRAPTELGLYGKNAFYTNETDDVFLVGEARRGKGKLNGNKDKATTLHTEVPASSAAMKKRISNVPEISDVATKELIETLQSSAELGPEWEIVHPDVPLKANENCQGVFSVSGYVEFKRELRSVLRF